MYKIAKDKHDGVTFNIDYIWGRGAEEAQKSLNIELAFIKSQRISFCYGKVLTNQVVLARGIQVSKRMCV